MSLTWQDHATTERRDRLWGQQHPWLLRATWATLTGVSLGCWWIAFRIGIWIVLGR